jgi:hypothetical protein
MSDLVFAKTSYTYQSYVDFWRLVELAGFETCFVKDIDLERDAVYVTTPINGEIRPHVKHRRSILTKPQQAKIIWFNLERCDSGNYEIGKIVGNECVTKTTDEILEYVDHIWVGDRYYTVIDPRTIHVLLGSDSRLAGGPPGDKVWDVCTLSYNNHRRDQIYGPLKQQVRMAPGSAWDGDRDHILRSSRSMVYVHQTPMPIGAPLRMALAAAYKLPVISEQLADAYPHRDGHDVLLAPYDQIIPRTLGALQGSLAELGENLHRKLCVELPFRKCVEEGIERTLNP